MNYTKGEWKLQKSPNGYILYSDYKSESSEDLALVYDVADNKGREMLEANAHLISAAPDMYEALQSWEELWGMRPLDSGADMQMILRKCWIKTYRALAKAEGK